MLTLHSFLQTVFFFVRSLTVKVTKKMYRTSSVLMTGMMVVAVIAFSANGFGGSGKNALAAPLTEECGEEPDEDEETEGSSFVTEAKIQFGLLNTDSEGQHLAGALLAENVREKQRQQAEAQTEIETLQKQILKEKQEEEARKKAEEERRAARKIQVSDEDYQTLLRIVQAEAGICDDKGKILVADVIINRVHSGKFPNTVKSVVYQPSQFQPVSNGSINSVKVSPETVACVDRALEGEDYSQGALYFMNRRVSGSAATWFDNRLTYLFAHDGHEFFK
ncbi:MAG: cell wall hydrolase [Enterocloster sp.]